MKKLDVVHAIIRNRDKFLIGKRSLSKKSGPGCWATIGGRVENFESLHDGLVRECLEEIGIKIKPIKEIAKIDEQEATHYWFEVEIISGEPFLANDENSDLMWATISVMERLSPLTADDLKILQLNY